MNISSDTKLRFGSTHGIGNGGLAVVSSNLTFAEPAFRERPRLFHNRNPPADLPVLGPLAIGAWRQRVFPVLETDKCSATAAHVQTRAGLFPRLRHGHHLRGAPARRRREPTPVILTELVIIVKENHTKSSTVTLAPARAFMLYYRLKGRKSWPSSTRTKSP